MVKLEAPAKVNLFLRVLAREESGYHQLETLFAALEFGDSLSLRRTSGTLSLESEGIPMGLPEENLAMRAAREYLARGGAEGGVEIFIQKRIPVMAGLGGGSSDAAATLRGLQTLFPGSLGEEEILGLAAELGADVPFFLNPSPLALAWGRGDRLLPLAALPPVPVILAVPPVKVETGTAYRRLALEREGSSRSGRPRVLRPQALESWDGVAHMAENDFEDVVFPAHPILQRIRQGFRDTGSLFSLLSGSGGALFAVYPEAGGVDRVRTELEARFPDTEFILTRTRPGLSGPRDTAGG